MALSYQCMQCCVFFRLLFRVCFLFVQAAHSLCFSLLSRSTIRRYKFPSNSKAKEICTTTKEYRFSLRNHSVCSKFTLKMWIITKIDIFNISILCVSLSTHTFLCHFDIQRVYKLCSEQRKDRDKGGESMPRKSIELPLFYNFLISEFPLIKTNIYSVFLNNNIFTKHVFFDSKIFCDSCKIILSFKTSCFSLIFVKIMARISAVQPLAFTFSVGARFRLLGVITVRSNSESAQVNGAFLET